MALENSFDQDIYREKVTLSDSEKQQLAMQMASASHQDFLEQNNKKNPDGSWVPRLRPLKPGDEEWTSQHPDKVKDGKIDIALNDISQLSPGWQKENVDAARHAIDFVADYVGRGEKTNTTVFETEGGEAIHEAWKARRVADGSAENADNKKNMGSFASLPEDEQKKDVDKLRMAVRGIENYIRQHGKN